MYLGDYLDTAVLYESGYSDKDTVSKHCHSWLCELEWCEMFCMEHPWQR